MMISPGDLLPPPEAAILARVKLRDVNRVIDEKLLPDGFFEQNGGRRLHIAACPFISFYFHTAKALTAPERSRLIWRLCDRMSASKILSLGSRWRQVSGPADWTIDDGVLTVNLWEFATGAEDRQAELARARDMVVEDPEILSGTPVIKGTRIPVYDIAASVAAKLPRERIRSAYEDLDDRIIDQAVIYAQAHPPCGRPRRSAGTVPPAVIVSRRTVRRKRSA